MPLLPISGEQQQRARNLLDRVYRQAVLRLHLGRLVTEANKLRYSSRPQRWLEIGPGPRRLPGFETLNIVPGLETDYVADAARPLPFPDGTFDLIYASHILEHVPWFRTKDVLAEWVRILRPGGVLEVWVPDGLKICRAFVEAEDQGFDPTEKDPWFRFNPDRDPCLWASGRIFSYGGGTLDPCHHNWHRALFSERYLAKLLADVGLVEIQRLDRSRVRGHDHGWINLGMSGRKPEAVS